MALPLTVGGKSELAKFSTGRFFIWPPVGQNTVGIGSSKKRFEEFGIQPADPNIETSTLSGGNMQKILLARELTNQPDMIVAVNPTAGLDIATVDFVHREITRQANEGAGVLLVSEDLDELLVLCDRILVIFQGHIIRNL